MLFNILSVIGKGIEFAYVLGKFVVDNGKLFEADAVQLDVENAVLSFQIFGVIVVGEFHVYILFLADAHALHLLLKARYEGVAAKQKSLLFSRAAVELFAVHAAAVIYHDLVSAFRGAVAHFDETRVFLGCGVDLGIYFLRGDFNGIAFDCQSLVFPKLHFRLDRHRCGKDKPFFV